MKKALSVLVILTIFMSLCSCGGIASKEVKIPDVLGLAYTDAIEILETEGFEVKAVEASVGNFSEKLLYPLEKLSKGTVFKVDNYILDNLGHLTKDYDVYYDGELVSIDKNVVIYYAEEDYLLNENTVEESDLATSIVVTEESTELGNLEDIAGSENEGYSSVIEENTLSDNFKSAMDEYENFMNDYVQFMKKYNSNPTDFSLLVDYADYISEYADFAKEFAEWEDSEMNAAELSYYIEVQTRVNKKLLEIAS